MNRGKETPAKRVLVIAALLGLMVAGPVSRATAAEPEAIYFNGKIVTRDAAESTAAAVPVLQQAARPKTPPTIRYTTAISTSANGQDMPADLDKFQMSPGIDRIGCEELLEISVPWA